MSRLTAADDLYAVMEIESSASAEDIKIAYRRLAHQHHPDRNPGDDQAEERFKQLQQAYSILSDPERRAKYDQLRTLTNREPIPAVMDDLFSSIGEFFEEIFGSGGNVVHISFERALQGGPVMVRGKDGSLTRIVLPPGIKKQVSNPCFRRARRSCLYLQNSSPPRLHPKEKQSSDAAVCYRAGCFTRLCSNDNRSLRRCAYG